MHGSSTRISIQKSASWLACHLSLLRLTQQRRRKWLERKVYNTNRQIDRQHTTRQGLNYMMVAMAIARGVSKRLTTTIQQANQPWRMDRFALPFHLPFFQNFTCLSIYTKDPFIPKIFTKILCCVLVKDVDDCGTPPKHYLFIYFFTFHFTLLNSAIYFFFSLKFLFVMFYVNPIKKTPDSFRLFISLAFTWSALDLIQQF